MRGKACVEVCCLTCVGITPACAGKSFVDRRYRHRTRDHPRVCGEKTLYSGIRRVVLGSPPRVRGKVLAALMPENRVGITPACAGKSFVSPQYILDTTGSPPRVRGKVLSLVLNSVSTGITPACAGKSQGFRVAVAHAQGSPPRVRGKVSVVIILLMGIGITPACAGKRLKRSHSIGHFSYILCLFHSVLHRASASGGSRAGPCAPPCLPAQNAVPV